jgi:stringent starvation protein B
MSEPDDPLRIDALLASLVNQRMEESLGRIEEALAAWRRGDCDVMGPHLEALRHVARTGALSARVTRARDEGPERLVRDALDAGLCERDEFVRLTGKAPEEVEPLPPLDEEVAASLTAPLPEKRSVVDAMLKDGPVLLHLDARRAGVRVPTHLASDPALVLRIGYSLSPAIPDLVVGEDGVRATLTFRGVPHACEVPWSALFAVTNEAGQGLVYDKDVPPEVAARMKGEDDEGEGEADEPPASPEPSPPRGRHLKLV